MLSTIRYLTFAIVVTGCTFVPPGPAIIPPADSPTPQPCEAGEQGVALCVDFEEVPLTELVLDRSPYQHLVTAINVASTPRVTGEQAALLSKESSLRVAESPMLDLADFTIEMWIRPDQKPPGKKDKDGVAGLFENFGRYTMQLKEDLRVRCGLVDDLRDTSEEAVPLALWSHVVCRYAGGEMRVYLNGHLSSCSQIAAPDPIPDLILAGSVIGARFNAAGLDLSDRLVGGVDNVRVYDHGLPQERICTSAGRSVEECNLECPSGGDDGGDGGDDGGGRGGRGD